jgi:hypothetical protein
MPAVPPLGELIIGSLNGDPGALEAWPGVVMALLLTSQATPADEPGRPVFGFRSAKAGEARGKAKPAASKITVIPLTMKRFIVQLLSLSSDTINLPQYTDTLEGYIFQGRSSLGMQALVSPLLNYRISLRSLCVFRVI